jgi:hypothetical protein
VFGGDLLIPRIGTRFEAGAGIAFENDANNLRFAADGGFVKRVGLSVDGLISHELDLGALVIVGGDVDVIARLSYRLNLEAGHWMLRPEVGPAYDIRATELGFYVGFGVLRTLSAAGGGGFY